MSTDDLAEQIATLPLVDHHVHTSLAQTPTLAELAGMLSESDRPSPAGTSPFDTQLGFAVRRHCAPLLGLAAHAPIEEYYRARAELGAEETDRRLLSAAGVEAWVVDSGYQAPILTTLDAFADRVPGGRVSEVVRLETTLESVAAGSTAADLMDRFAARFADLLPTAIGLKSVIAYRHGFDIPGERPSAAEVQRAAGTWLAEIDAGATPRVEDPVLARELLWRAAETQLPLQLHVGFGDPDVDLRRGNPLLLRDWIEAVEPLEAPLMLLHCYPFHREAGFLAHSYPQVHLDVGLAINYAGAASAAIVAETLEIAPFHKVLYSSDAWGPAELHHLGAVLWRRAMTRALGAWVEEGEWSAGDAMRIARLMARENAERVYGDGLTTVRTQTRPNSGGGS